MAKKRKRIEKKVSIGGKRVSVYGYSAFEIQQKIEELERQEERKRFPLFNDVLDDWQEHHFDEIATGTQICYKPAIKRAEQEFEGMRICDITPSDISSLLQRLAALGYSQQTVKVQKIVIKLIFKYAQGKSLVIQNPAEIAEIPKRLPKSTRELPSDSDIDIVMNSVDKPFGIFALFLLTTGCRRGEALAVKWSDVDFENKLIRINKKIVYESNKPILENHTKTKAGIRTVVLPQALYSQLENLKSDPEHFVFGNGDTPFSNTQFKKRWAKYLKATGLDITPHQLRHAYATILYDAGVDEKVTQNLMGHSTIEVTKNIYTHIRKQRIEQARVDLDTYLSKNIFQKSVS